MMRSLYAISKRVVIRTFAIFCVAMLSCYVLSVNNVFADTGLYGVKLESGFLDYSWHTEYHEMDASYLGADAKLPSCFIPAPWLLEYSGKRDINTNLTYNGFNSVDCFARTGSVLFTAYGDDCKQCSEQYPQEQYSSCSNSYNEQPSLKFKAGSYTTDLSHDHSDDVSWVISQCGITAPAEFSFQSRAYTSSYTFKLVCDGDKKAKLLSISGDAVVSKNYYEPGAYTNFLINGIPPKEIGYHFAKWEIPVEGRCGDLVTLTPTVSEGIGELEVSTIHVQYVQYCDLAINSFAGSSQLINPFTGGSINLSGNISSTSGNPVNWTLQIADKTYTGSGTSFTVSWDGKDASGKVVEPGSYTATLTVTSADSECNDTKTLNFEVVPAPDGQCGLLVDFGSSANVASGALTHSQELFYTKGSGLTTNMTLYYNSQDSHSASLGTGWSHNYDIYLKQSSDGSIVYRDGSGKRKLYTLSNGSYVGRPGDYSTLVKNADGTFTLTQKDGLKYNFGQNGKIATIIDRNGNTSAFTYTNGNLTAVTDPVGRITALGYDAANHVISIADPASNSYTLTYNGGTLASVTYPDGGVWRYRYTYDANAFMRSKTDPLGNTTTYAYDGNHKVVSSTDPEGKTRSIGYPQGTDVAKATTFTEKDGGVWTYTYDTQKGTLSSKTDPQGGVTSYTYDANGNRLSTIAPDATTTSYGYDASGNMTSMTDALGQTTTNTYNTYGQVTSVTDPQGKVTSYNYDTRGNLASFTDPAGATMRYEYDAKGNITKVIDPVGDATSFTYDQYGNLSSVTDPSGATSSYTFDTAGNVISQADASGATTRFEYNVKNQLLKATDPQGNVTSYTYDANGNKTSQTDANGNATLYAYNYKGQLIKITDPLGNVTTYTYGATGCPSCGGGTDKLTAVTDAKGNTTSYSYDSLGRLTKETDPLGNSTTYVYDAKGKLVAKTDAKGNTVSQTYDPAGRLIGKSYPDGTYESFAYDGSGNLLNWQAPRENITSGYDAASRLIAKTYQNLDKGIKYEYDSAGRKSAMIDPEGGRTVYTYDTAGRIAKITDPAGNWATYSYDSAGRRSGVTYSNGTSTTYTYDTAGRLLGMATNGPSGVISSYQYTYDKVGNRLTVKEAGGNSTTYTYDKLYRLTAYDETRPNAAKGSFEYDPVGNRTKMLLALKFLPGDSRSFTYTYNLGNQLLDIMEKGRHSPIETVFGYDKNGSLVSQAVTQGKTTAITSYLYDYQNRLSKVSTPDGKTVTIDNLTDGFSRLAKSTSTGTTKYIHDGMSVLSEYDTAGSRTARYTLGLGTDENIARKDSTGTYFYHFDGLGSVTAITDGTGKVVAKYDYEPFGRIKETSGSTLENPYTFTGREWDKETGLYYYRARYYDPMGGRFIQKDPIGFKGGINGFAYTGNAPVNRVDPSGLAFFAKRALTGMPWIPGLSGNPLLDIFDAEVSHEQLFFEDGNSPFNVGFFSDGTLHYDESSFGYKIEPGFYDDCIMRKAYKNVSLNKYKLMFPLESKYNCQNWADDVRKEYYKLKNQ